MGLLHCKDLSFVIFVGLAHLVVPVGIELLELCYVRVFALLTLLLVHELGFLHFLDELLLLQLCDSVFCHFCLDVAALLLACQSVLLHCLPEMKNILVNKVFLFS